MGVDIDAWRARIGRYAGREQRKSTAKINEGLANNFLMLLLAAGVIGLLLVIGGIEENPGPYPCKLCPTVPETIASSIRHQHQHATRNSNFTYHCPSLSCSYYTLSFGALNFHVSKQHRATRHVDPAATVETACPYGTASEPCTFSTTSLRNFVQHLYCHLENNIKVDCPIEGCTAATRSFCKKSGLQAHLSVFHKNWRAEGCPLKISQEFQVHPPDCTENVLDYNDSTTAVDFEEPNISYFNENSDLLNDDLILDSIGKFYLHLYAQNLLPQTYIQEICNTLMSITEVVHARIKIFLSSELEKLGVDKLKVNSLCYEVLKADLLYTTHHKSAPGPSMTSHYLRKEYFKKRFDYLAPEQIGLDEHDPQKTLQYVSIRQTLSKLLEDPTVQEELEESFLRRDKKPTNVVSDYTHGSLYESENHPAREFNLFLYQDSYNSVLNALGSAKNKFKTLAMYFTIGNFKPHVRSLIVTKFLVLLVRESIFKAVKAKKCLETLMTELKDMEKDGILYKGETLKFTVTFMLGDNLGQHLIGGFIESFSTEYMCRYCDMTATEFKANPSITNPRRTIQDYEDCVLRASASKESCKGIKGTCELNCLKYFHATSHLPPCIAHDLFEGVVAYDLAGIIRRFVKDKKWFSYKLLNRRIQNFKCHGSDGPNKPAFVRKKGDKLGGHAIQNWTLLRLLYLIIGDKIQDFEDPGWLLYLQLKELCEHFCAPSFLKTDVPYIADVLVPLYFERRAEVLTMYNLKPKYHFMAHMCNLMLFFGPLLYLWTLPFEQKHKFFKQLMRMTRNFINPEFSCAERAQMHFSYITHDNYLLEKGCVENGSRRLSHGSFTGKVAEFVENLHLTGNWYDTSSLSANGLLYEIENIILLSQLYTGTLSVGIIKVIMLQGKQFHFIVELRQAHYHPAKGIHEINFDAEADVVMISPDELKYPVPHPVYNDKTGQVVFSLKFAVMEEPEQEDEN